VGGGPEPGRNVDDYFPVPPLVSDAPLGEGELFLDLVPASPPPP
jgi:hypothetical protein